jgi:hypothetical protein
LEAEELRDALLAVSGRLDLTMGGSLLHVGNREFLFDHTSKDQTSYDSRRRSVYLPVIRNHLYDVFTLFDYSDASVVNGDRNTSTIAPQALFLLNGELMIQCAQSLAERSASPTSDDRERVERLYRLAYGRGATEHEMERAIGFVDRFAAEADSRDQAWTALSQMVLASNEFLYVR